MGGPAVRWGRDSVVFTLAALFVKTVACPRVECSS